MDFIHLIVRLFKIFNLLNNETFINGFNLLNTETFIHLIYVVNETMLASINRCLFPLELSSVEWWCTLGFITRLFSLQRTN